MQITLKPAGDYFKFRLSNRENFLTKFRLNNSTTCTRKWSQCAMMNAKVSGKGNDWPNPALVTTIDLLRMKKNSMIEVVVTVWLKLYPNCIM